MTIRCIAFDLDDTLWDCRPVIERAEQRFYAWLMVHYPRIPARYSQAELVDKRVSYMQNYPELQYNLTDLRKKWLAALAQEEEYSSALVEPAFEVFWLARNEVAFFDETLEVLHRLANRFVMGVISNGNACVHHIGIGHLFQFVHSAAKAGVTKPHSAIFQQALQEVGIAPHEAVYVGDDPRNDIQGAAQAGWRTVWFNPSQQPWEVAATQVTDTTVPDAEIHHWKQLETVLAAL